MMLYFQKAIVYTSHMVFQCIRVICLCCLLTTSSTFTLHLWMLWQYCCHLHIYYHVLIEQYFFKEFRWNIHTSINQMATFHYSHFREFAKVYPSLQFFMYMHTFQTLDPIPFVHCCYLYWPLHFWSPHWHLLISSIPTKEQVLPDPIYFTKLIYSLTLSLRLVTLTTACLFDTCNLSFIIVYLTTASLDNDWHCHHSLMIPYHTHGFIITGSILWWCLSYWVRASINFMAFILSQTLDWFNP